MRPRIPPWPKWYRACAINVDAYGLPRKSWPLGALNDGDWSYIRSEGNAHEELFHLRNDGKQQRNLARDPAAQPILDRMRQTLRSLPAGRSTPNGSIAERQNQPLPHDIFMQKLTQ